MSMRFAIARELPFEDRETVSETKRASAARPLEAAIAIGAKLYRETGSEADAARLALVVAAHERVTGSKMASVKLLADPAEGQAAHMRAVAFKALSFLED